jgi:threonine/homoserine/homoserine lactone efflux protein
MAVTISALPGSKMEFLTAKGTSPEWKSALSAAFGQFAAFPEMERT